MARRTAELSVRNEELLALNELAGSLTRSLDPEAILAGALDAVRAVLPTTAGRGFRIGREGLMASRAEGDDASPPLEAVAVAAITGNQLVTRPDGDGVLIGLPMGTGAGPLGALGLRATVAVSYTHLWRAACVPSRIRVILPVGQGGALSSATASVAIREALPARSMAAIAS